MSLTQPILSDIFLSKDVKRILNNKYVIFIGDSVNRSMYKDMVKLYQKNEHLTDTQLKLKGEPTFENDRLLEGGQFGTMSNDTTYTEVREFQTNHVLIRFYFITRCNSNYLQYICQTIRNDEEKPDVIIMNSCYWDLSRYGTNSVEQYKLNLPIGIQSLLNVLPKETVFIWTSALPVSKDIYGGFMGAPGTSNIDQKVRLRVRENAIEANRFAAQVMNDFGVDFLDLHYYFRLQQFRRAYDGIHWDATAHRRISNLLLHHLCDCWDLATPGRFVVSVRDPIKVVNNKTEKESLKAVEAVKQDENKSIQVNKEIKVVEALKEEKKENNEKVLMQVEEEDDEIVVIKVVEGNKGKKDEKINGGPQNKTEVKANEGPKKAEVNANEEAKKTELKVNEGLVKVNEGPKKPEVRVNEGAKKAKVKVNEGVKKITEEKVNSNKVEKNVVASRNDPSSSPTSSTSSIENRDPKNKTKEPPQTSVTRRYDNKKQRRDTNDRRFAPDNSKNSNRQFNDNQEQNSNRNNNIPSLFESTAFNYSAQSFFNPINSGLLNLVNVQTQNLFQNNAFSTPAFNFTDAMLNLISYNFSNNQNPYTQILYNQIAQNYISNGFNYSSNDSNSNNSNQMSSNSNYSSSNHNNYNSRSRRNYR